MQRRSEAASLLGGRHAGSYSPPPGSSAAAPAGTGEAEDRPLFPISATTPLGMGTGQEEGWRTRFSRSASASMDRNGPTRRSIPNFR